MFLPNLLCPKIHVTSGKIAPLVKVVIAHCSVG